MREDFACYCSSFPLHSTPVTLLLSRFGERWHSLSPSIRSSRHVCTKTQVLSLFTAFSPSWGGVHIFSQIIYTIKPIESKRKRKPTHRKTKRRSRTPSPPLQESFAPA